MLYFIAVWIVLSIICCIIGTALLNELQARLFDRPGDRGIVAIWLGVVVLAIALLATSLILPLSLAVGAAVALGLCALSLRSRPTRIELTTLASQPVILQFLGLATLVAALTARAVTWPETGYYEYQLIQWLAQYGTVPGLALFFSPLGAVSSWLALAAPFNPEILAGRVSAVTNSFVFLIAVWHFLISLSYSFKRQTRLSDAFTIVFSLIMLPLAVALEPFSEMLVSPSPNLPVAFLVGIVGWTLLIIFERSRGSETPVPDRIIPLVLATGAVTIKSTALPLLLVSSLFFGLSKGVSKQRILQGGAIVTLLLAPLLIANVTTSGCLISASFLCFKLPWSPVKPSLQSVTQLPFSTAIFLLQSSLPYGALLVALLTALLLKNQIEAMLSQAIAKFFLQSSRLKISDFVLSFFLFLLLLVAFAFVRPRLFLPPSIQKIEVMQKQVNDITYRFPKNQQYCWATQLPCTLTDLQKIKLGDAKRGLAGGFVHELSAN